MFFKLWQRILNKLPEVESLVLVYKLFSGVPAFFGTDWPVNKGTLYERVIVWSRFVYGRKVVFVSGPTAASRHYQGTERLAFDVACM